METRPLIRILAGVLALLSERPQTATPRTPSGSSQDATLYAAVLRHYLHQDAILWSRVQVLLAIQAGVLAGAVALRTNAFVAAAVLLLGAFFTLLLLLLGLKDELDRDINLPLLDALARRITAAAPFPDLALDLRTPIRMASPRRPWHVPLRGRTILRFSLILLMVLDVALAWGFLTDPSTMATFLGP